VDFKRVNELSISLGHYLVLGAIMVSLGVFGALWNRRNMLMMLMSLEISLFGVLLTLLSFSKFHHHLDGQVFALFILAVGASKFIVGVVSILVFYREKRSVSTKDMVDFEQ
jgi:NADH-quinone oxidoreductase subunit K